MKAVDAEYPESFQAHLIAPCGMNCGICIGHLREKKRCPGCNGDDGAKPGHCVSCRIKNCDEIAVGETSFCFECAKFPCARLRRLDTRYRTNYGMSMMENLQSVRELGIEGFLEREKGRWKCSECGAVLCVHRERCIYCGHVG